MHYEKSCFKFVFLCDQNYVKKVIDGFLWSNNFKFVQKKYGTYFVQNDFIKGSRFLEYYFSGNTVSVYVYLNSYKHPIPLDDQYLSSIPKQVYKADLVPLFETLDKLGRSDSYMAQTDGYGSVQAPYLQSSQALQSYVSNNRNQKGKLAGLSLFFSLFVIILALLDSFYWFIMLVADLYMACVGLKSEKRWFAVAALCLLGFSIVIIILKMLGYINFATFLP